MEPTKEHISFYIYIRYKLGIGARRIHEELVFILTIHILFEQLLDGSGILLMSERVLKMKQVLGDQRRV
jgi:hypothetical protein